jgi:hypothetical protein
MKLGSFTTLLNRSNSDKVQEEVMMWFKGQAAHFYDLVIQKQVPRLNKCLDNVGDYFERRHSFTLLFL